MIPRAILSDHLEACIRGRRILAALFLTFEFDPGFFEQEVLPVLFDLPVSHAPAIRLLQLDDALRDCAGSIAVFYDADGLIKGSSGSAHLDVHRIPIHHRTGVFHPKNILLLVEERTPDESGYRAQSLLVGALSANLTRSGWWENVEVCHFEEIQEQSATRMRDDLLSLCRRLNRNIEGRASSNSRTPPTLQPLETIRAFLVNTSQRERRTSDQKLFPHFYSGVDSFPDFLEQCAGELIQGMNMEVISPYLGHAPISGPLEELIRRFRPRRVHIMLPRNRAALAACSEALFESVRKTDGVKWGKMPPGSW